MSSSIIAAPNVCDWAHPGLCSDTQRATYAGMHSSLSSIDGGFPGVCQLPGLQGTVRNTFTSRLMCGLVDGKWLDTNVCPAGTQCDVLDVRRSMLPLSDAQVLAINLPVRQGVSDVPILGLNPDYRRPDAAAMSMPLEESYYTVRAFEESVARPFVAPPVPPPYPFHGSSSAVIPQPPGPTGPTGATGPVQSIGGSRGQASLAAVAPAVSSAAAAAMAGRPSISQRPSVARPVSINKLTVKNESKYPLHSLAVSMLDDAGVVTGSHAGLPIGEGPLKKGKSRVLSTTNSAALRGRGMRVAASSVQNAVTTGVVDLAALLDAVAAKSDLKVMLTKPQLNWSFSVSAARLAKESAASGIPTFAVTITVRDTALTSSK